MVSQVFVPPVAELILALLLSSALNQVGLAQSTTPVEGHRQSIDATLSAANDAYGQKDFEQSLKLYSEALSRGALEATVSYNAACCAALCNEPDDAFDFLEQSIEFGWLDLKLAKQDSDLKSLHSDPRWLQFLASIELAIKLNETRWKSAAFATPYSENLTAAEKAAGLSRVWSEVKFNFVNFHLVPNLDWDAEYMACMPKVLASKSTFEYYRLLEELVAKLKDGHTNVYLPEVLSLKFNARPPIRTIYLEGKVIVARILDQSVKQTGIEVGQEVIAVNRIPVREYASKYIRPYMSASTRHDVEKRTFEGSLLRGPADDPVNLTLRKIEGEPIDVSLKRTSGGGLIASWFSRPAAFEMKVLDGNIAYVKLNSFSTSTALAEFTNAFEKIEATDGLILDLRENGGGNSSVGRRILGFLTDKSIPVTSWYTLQYRPAFRAWNRQPLSKHGSSGRTATTNNKHYMKPVVMLIGGDTFSAAEDTAAAFDMLERGKLIGQPTGGSTGQPLMFALPGGGRARVCTKHDSYADGTEFVGIGIEPDIAVELTLDDFRKHIDRTVEVAKQQLRK